MTNSSSPDLNAVAAEICALWRDYLENLSRDEAGRAELLKLFEPQMKLMQNWPQDGFSSWMGAFASPPETASSHDKANTDFQDPFRAASQDLDLGQDVHSTPSSEARAEPNRNADEYAEPAIRPVATPPISPATAATSDDGALRLAQLALRVAALEERISRIEASKARGVRKNSGIGEG